MAHVKTMAGPRKFTVVVYLTEEEHDFISFTADESGGTRAGWVRALIRRAMREEKEGGRSK